MAKNKTKQSVKTPKKNQKKAALKKAASNASQQKGPIKKVSKSGSKSVAKASTKASSSKAGATRTSSKPKVFSKVKASAKTSKSIKAKEKSSPDLEAKERVSSKAKTPKKGLIQSKVGAHPKAHPEGKGKAKKKNQGTESDSTKNSQSFPNAAPAAKVSSLDADKATAAKKGKTKKKEDVDLEDDFIPEDDFGSSEIGEYEEELLAVETMDEEIEEDLEWATESKPTTDDDIYLTDADGNRYCRSKDCDQLASVDAYCRFHYLLFWKRIQVRNKILADGKLAKYVEELTSRYPDKFLEMIRRDLRTQKDFLAAIHELEIDESESSGEAEEETQSFIDEVRGLGEQPSMDDDEF